MFIVLFYPKHFTYFFPDISNPSVIQSCFPYTAAICHHLFLLVLMFIFQDNTIFIFLSLFFCWTLFSISISSIFLFFLPGVSLCKILPFAFFFNFLIILFFLSNESSYKHIHNNKHIHNREHMIDFVFFMEKSSL